MTIRTIGFLCQLWTTFPAGPFHAGTPHAVNCGGDVETLLIDLEPADPGNPASPPQIVSTDAGGGGCGDQVIAFPPGLPAGRYILSGTVIPCGPCDPYAIRARVIEVK